MNYSLKTLSKYEFNKIKVPERFLQTPPSPEKLIHKVLVFTRESELEHILVDEDFNLVDGYCSYLIAQQVGVKFVKIKMIKSHR